MAFLIIISIFCPQSVLTSLLILITHNDHFHTALTLEFVVENWRGFKMWQIRQIFSSRTPTF